jgi:P27 family predicted phage terminase small subunit
MSGPRPTPTYLKLLRGNPGKRAVNKGEPQPERPLAVPEPPAYLGAYGAEEWRRVAPEMFRLGLLTVVDLHVFAAYCLAYESWRAAREALARVAEHDPAFSGLIIKTAKGTAMENPLFLAARQSAADMLKFAAEFGMTPAARSRISAGISLAPPAPSKFDGLIGGLDDPA